jgi:hypothetical protein
LIKVRQSVFLGISLLAVKSFFTGHRVMINTPSGSPERHMQKKQGISDPAPKTQTEI